MSIHDEYLEFLKSNDQSAPSPSNMLHVIKNELNPSTFKSMSTYIFSLSLSALATLAVCPQFGIGGWVFGHEFLHVLFAHGSLLCGAFCAFVYSGFSILISHFVLTRPIKRKLYNLQIPVLTIIPATLLGLAMGSASVFGEFFFFGTSFVLGWYLTTLVAQKIAIHQWGKYVQIK